MSQSAAKWVLALVVATIACAALVVIIAAMSPDQLRWADAWRAAWIIPLAVATGISTIEGIQAVRRARARAFGRSALAAVVGSTRVGRQAIRAVVDEERDRHARELHQQVLPPVTASLASLDAGQVATTSTMLRSLASELRTDLEHEQLLVLRLGGLEAALASAASRLEGSGLPCSADVQTDEGRPPWEVEVAVWRIAQEALNNALRHSSAASVSVAATSISV